MRKPRAEKYCAHLAFIARAYKEMSEVHVCGKPVYGSQVTKNADARSYNAPARALLATELTGAYEMKVKAWDTKPFYALVGDS